MSTATPTAELLFGPSDSTPMSTDESTIKAWSEAQASLASAAKVWLGTVRPDGRPHAMPVLLVLVDDKPCFTSRPGSHKSKNLAANPNCVITVAGETLDLVLEGKALRVYDEAEQRKAAAALKAKYDWDLTLRDGSAFSDDLPGSPEYAFYQVIPARGFGYGADGMTATRWRFE